MSKPIKLTDNVKVLLAELDGIIEDVTVSPNASRECLLRFDDLLTQMAEEMAANNRNEQGAKWLKHYRQKAAVAISLVSRKSAPLD